MVRFHRSKDLHGLDGIAYSAPGCPQASAFQTGDFYGSTTAVLYREGMYLDLCELDNHDTEETCMRLHFDFAALLVHELAHAAHAAAYGAWACEVPFEHRTMAEAGFEWEHYALGGLLRTRLGDGEQSLAEWPSASTGKYYLHEGIPIWVQGKLPDIEVQWYVPFCSVLKLFTASYWEKVVPIHGAQALKVSKEVGVRYNVKDEGYTTSFLPREWDENYGDGVPEHCYEDDDGYIHLLDPADRWQGFEHLRKIDGWLLYPEARWFRFWR
ncbi:hypothetical protein LTR36_001308 [Oleoguttula mirabilis]|uniref:Uncharacterized protein n=1 Tax=Oleoguttula mirabilis TaxID=1507867 RepID=A0AAV9JQ10_9PEZI|nr:hypothetical protein LTR36_001308 [Oleoguttula mirabilis]